MVFWHVLAQGGGKKSGKKHKSKRVSNGGDLIRSHTSSSFHRQGVRDFIVITQPVLDSCCLQWLVGWLAGGLISRTNARQTPRLNV